MEDELRRILRRSSRSLTNELAARLTSRTVSRYRELGPGVLAARCRMLVEALIESAHLGPEHLSEFASTIAEGQLAEGFELEELQQALRILEVIAWRIVANESTVDSLRGNLATLNATMGYARDELARVSLARAYAAAS